MKKIKIIHLIDNLKVGGAERQLVLLATSLDPERFEQIVFCMRESGTLAERLQARGIGIQVLNKRHKIDIRFLLRLIRSLQRERPAILLCWLFSANLWGRLAGFWVPRVKLIATERVEGHWKRFYHRWIDKVLYYLRTDILLVNSQGVIDYCFRHERLPKTKMRLVFNAIESNRRQKRALPRRDYQKIVSICRLTPQKGVETLIEAAKLVCAKFPRARFYVYGEGPKERDYMRLVEESGLGGAVCFPGKARVESIMGDADLFVSSSIYEGLPNAVMEAMSFGLPIVATDIGGTNELIESGKSGLLVPVKDHVKLAQSIEKVLRDPAEGERFGHAAWDRIYSRFDIRKIVQEMHKVFQELIPEMPVGEVITTDSQASSLQEQELNSVAALNVTDPVLAANIEIHRKEAALFDLIHPELFKGLEYELNQRDLNQIRSLLKEQSPLVLEIGAGTGRLTIEYLKRDFQVRAVDLSHEMLARLKQKTAPFYKLETFCMDAADFVSRQSYPVSLVSFSAVLHHLKDYQDILKKAVTLLRPGGILFISHEPVLRASQRRRGISFWLDKVDSILFRTWLLVVKGKLLPVTRYEGSDPYGTSGLDQEALLRILEQSGMEILRFELYAPRKTALVTNVDKAIFRTGHQFRLVAVKMG